MMFKYHDVDYVYIHVYIQTVCVCVCVCLCLSPDYHDIGYAGRRRRIQGGS
jgi:hypothetical protein